MDAGEAAAKELLALAAEVESGLLIFTMNLIAEYAINTPTRGINDSQNQGFNRVLHDFTLICITSWPTSLS